MQRGRIRRRPYLFVHFRVVQVLLLGKGATLEVPDGLWRAA